MVRCLFVSDLHGHVDRYEKLFASIVADPPRLVLLGGDLLPNPWMAASAVDPSHRDFVNGYLGPSLARIREALGASYPEVLLILGNDDARIEESSVLAQAARGLWRYVHDRSVVLFDRMIFGYAFVPPSPFTLKDWERYDVSRCTDPGCVSPEEGFLSVPVPDDVRRHATIARDLEGLTRGHEVSRAVFLFHAPPYDTKLDRADLDGKSCEHVPLDVHIGSIAIRRFIETRQPHLTLHGHVHESARLTGCWSDRIGRTCLLSAAHDGPELALVEFDLDAPEAARRSLL